MVTAVPYTINPLPPIHESKDFSRGQLSAEIIPESHKLILCKTFENNESYSSTFKLPLKILSALTPQLLSDFQTKSYPVVTRTKSGKDISDLKALSIYVNELVKAS